MVSYLRVAAYLLVANCANNSALAEEKPSPPKRPVLAEVLTPDVAMSGIARFKVDNLEGLDVTKFRLILDDHTFRDLLPQYRKTGEIDFPLTGLRADKMGGWTLLVGSPPLAGSRTVRVALSGADGLDVETAADQPKPEIALTVFRGGTVLLGVAAVVILIWAVLRLAQRTDALRDTSAPLPPAPDRRQYSLGRCQMAFWFVLITNCFLLVWIVTGDFNGIISPQSLTLLGISGTTAIGAAAMDAAKSDVGGAAYKNQITMHTTFWSDILQDASGWAFHRLQVLIWTLLLGGIALWSTYTNLTLPTFDNNLLIMVGISSGLYLGFKFPEKPA